MADQILDESEVQVLDESQVQIDGEQPKVEYKGGSGGAFAVSALDSATFGGLPNVLALQDAFRSGKSGDDFWGEYRAKRDYYKQGLESMKEKETVATYAGMAAPAVLSMGAGAGANLLKAGSTGAIKGLANEGFKEGLKTAAKVGATSGAVGGLVGGNADLTTGDPAEIAEAGLEAGGGAVLGAGIGTVLHSVGSIPGAIKDFGKRQVLPVLGATKGDMIRLAEQKGGEAAGEMGEEILKSGAMKTFGSSVGQNQSINNALKTDVGPKIGAVVNDLDNMNIARGQNMLPVVDDAVSGIMGAADDIAANTPGAGRVTNGMYNIAEEVMDKSKGNNRLFDYIKTQSSNFARGKMGSAAKDVTDDAENAIYGSMRDAMMSNASKLDQGKAAQLGGLNKTFEALSEGLKATKGGASGGDVASMQNSTPVTGARRGIMALLKEYTGPAGVKAAYFGGKALDNLSKSEAVKHLIKLNPTALGKSGALLAQYIDDPKQWNAVYFAESQRPGSDLQQTLAADEQ